MGVFRHHQAALYEHYRDWDSYKSIGRWVPWSADERLDLPIHQILFRPPGGSTPEPWEPNYDERQFFLNEAEGGIWLCRRDPRITLHVRQLAQRSPDGTPIVAPEVQLLYKARHAAAKDEHDFRLVADRIRGTRRAWLRDALELVHPGHRWIQALP